MINFNPVHEIVSFGPFHIYSWGLMFVIGFIVACILILREAKKKNIDQGFMLNVMLFVLIGAIIGGRLFFVLENMGYFSLHLLEIFAFGKGGETSYGGIIFALLFSWLYVKFSRNKDKISFSELLDLVAPYVVLGLAIGRIGCFLNWDDFGISSSLPWSINAAGEGVARHPTMLYETVYCLIIFGILMIFKKIKEREGRDISGINDYASSSVQTRLGNAQNSVALQHTENNLIAKQVYTDKSSLSRKLLLNKNGTLFLYFLIFYSFFRFLNDFLRVYENYFLGLALSQWILLLTFIISWIIVIKKKD